MTFAIGGHGVRYGPLAIARAPSGLMGGFDPTAIAGLRAWYRTDAELFQDAARTTPAVSNADPVGCWGDQTVSGLDLTQTVAGSRGTLVTNAINGLPAVAFDGSADNLATYGVFPRGTSWLVPGGFTNTGLAYDSSDGTLWVGDYTNSKAIHATLAGTYIGEIALSGRPQGIAYDSSDDTLWWSDPADGKIRHISMAGVEQADEIALAGAAGLSYEATSDCLWVSPTAQTVGRYSCVNGALQETITLNTLSIDGVGYDAATDALWLACDVDAPNARYGRLVRVDAADGSIDGTYDVAAWPEDVAVVGSDLYYCADAGFHAGVTNGNRVYKVPIADVHLGYTVGTWVNPIGTSGAVWSHGNAVTVGPLGIGFALLVTSTTNARPFITGSDQTRAFADRAKVAGWRFLCLVIDDSAHTMTFYDNGSPVGAAISTAAVYGSHATHYRHSIGASVDGDALRPNQCQIAEQVIYAGALSAADVAALYAYGTARYGI